MCEKWEERRENWVQRRDAQRNGYEVDYSRTVHSSSLRRLQGKTQVYNLNDSDFYRSRLTHSLEVGQIALGIKKTAEKKLNAEEDRQIALGIKKRPEEKPEKLIPDFLIQTISLLHDIGHPPFGHAGEKALNECMKECGDFEGNAQTLRIISKLEDFSKDAGMNLTRRTMLGILKYPASHRELNEKKDSEHERKNKNPIKCFYNCDLDVVNWIFKPFDEKTVSEFRGIEDNKTRFKSLDCSIMDVADDITNAVHDLEDAIKMKKINIETARSFLGGDFFKHYHEYLKINYQNGKADIDTFKKLFLEKNKREIGRLVGYFKRNIEIEEQFSSEEILLSHKVVLTKEALKIIIGLKDLIRKKVIMSPQLQHLEFKGQEMVKTVFNIFANEPKKLLQQKTYDKYIEEDEDKRVICDYISGMTDRYLQMIFERLKVPGKGSIFDKL